MTALQIANLLSIATQLIQQIEEIRQQTAATQADVWHEVTTDFAGSLGAYQAATAAAVKA